MFSCCLFIFNSFFISVLPSISSLLSILSICCFLYLTCFLSICFSISSIFSFAFLFSSLQFCFFFSFCLSSFCSIISFELSKLLFLAFISTETILGLEAGSLCIVFYTTTIFILLINFLSFKFTKLYNLEKIFLNCTSFFSLLSSL